MVLFEQNIPESYDESHDPDPFASNMVNTIFAPGQRPKESGENDKNNAGWLSSDVEEVFTMLPVLS